jgi:hypothetical protein
MTDAAHDQHSEPRRPRDHDRIVTTGPAVSSPPVPNFFVEGDVIQKNRSRTTVAEPIWGNAGGTALYRGSGRLFRPRPGRLERT